ncbi:hypothetical protein GCM10008018_22860 [Paenibacillus marchantiophytorum]|uniref:DUF6973 domain-containing protein n=1 Tax=Paenibacillus marchantiophytorum TaxID=1619310 RepID=A0ABQ1ELC7_9BACL|nr:hypothetical protein [Paenibacillus marchantiophytorum]GFZ76815.1 hypothetical protein GCM10008018_22860 [Paenibacillus marchantiophytorum]
MLNLKKSLVTLSAVTMLVASIAPMTAFAESSEKIATANELEQNSNVQNQKSLTVDDVLNNPQFKSLTFDDDTVKLFKEIEEFKKNNPQMTSNEIIQHFDSRLDNRQQNNLFSARAIYDPYVAKWKELTNAEKVLVITTPGQALIVDSCRDKAVDYSNNSAYGSLDGNGTKKDAFRHAIWNALMCKYINKLSAYAWATAHEAQDDPNYYTTIFDGFTGLQHKNMDLHNNEKGRDCWNIITDGILWTSDQTLQNRVAAKIQAWEMVVLR